MRPVGRAPPVPGRGTEFREGAGEPRKVPITRQSSDLLGEALVVGEFQRQAGGNIPENEDGKPIDFDHDLLLVSRWLGARCSHEEEEDEDETCEGK